jgi:hypothetical protein
MIHLCRLAVSVLKPAYNGMRFWPPRPNRWNVAGSANDDGDGRLWPVQPTVDCSSRPTTRPMVGCNANDAGWQIVACCMADEADSGSWPGTSKCIQGRGRLRTVAGLGRGRWYIVVTPKDKGDGVMIHRRPHYWSRVQTTRLMADFGRGSVDCGKVKDESDGLWHSQGRG